MLRVVHFISGDLWAGAEVMAYNLVRELLEQPGLDVSVYLLNRGALAEKMGKLSVDLTVEDESRRSFLHLLTSTRQWLNHHQPHIIHSHRYKENILAYLASPCGRRLRLIATQHGLPEVGASRLFSRDRFVPKLNRSLLRYSFDKVVGVSNNIVDHYSSEHSFPAERLSVIHNGIDLPLKSVQHLAQQKLRVGSAGRLFAVKDYSLMIEIAGCMQPEPVEARFMLAGEGPQRSSLERNIRENLLTDTFSLLGHLDDMSAFYDSLDVYINTSEHEGIPMSILEAMAHGLPVVAPDVGGIGEIIEDGVDGFLVTGRTAEKYAALILKLQDVALRRRIGEAAREKIRRSFSTQSMALQYAQLYRELVS